MNEMLFSKRFSAEQGEVKCFHCKSSVSENENESLHDGKHLEHKTDTITNKISPFNIYHDSSRVN